MSEARKPENEEPSQEKKLTVGQQLRSQRKARGISLVEVTEHTKIGKKYLEALEEERFDYLPCATYIQGFLRAYAKYLEMDDEKLIHQYQEDHLEKIKDCQEETVKEETERQNNQSIWVPLLSMVILAGLGAGLFLLWPAEKEEPAEMQEALVPQSVAETLDQNMPAAGQQSSDILTLKIRAKEKTWITLMIDGKQEPDVTMATNEERLWKAKDRFVLWTGNAGGIEVYFNGELQPALGKQGEVRKEIVFERKEPVVEPVQSILD